MGNAVWWVVIRDGAVAHVAESPAAERTLCGIRIGQPAHWWYGADTLSCANCDRLKGKGKA